MKKRIFAMLFCLTMLLAFLSATAYATSVNPPSDTVILDSLTITGLDAPVPRNSQDLSITIAENSFVEDTGMMWCDITDDHRFLDYTVKFQPGHQYLADIYVTLKPGYAFSSNATVCVDGKWITPESNSGECLTFRVLFDPCEGSPHIHTPSDWIAAEGKHYTLCPGCDNTLKEEDHKGGVATCAEEGKCTVCGYAYIEKNENHTPDAKWTASDNQYHARLCTICGAPCNSEAHKPGPAATDTTPQKCTVCDYTITPATHTHTLTSVAEVAPTCTGQGIKSHYICSGCNIKFSDADGKNVIADDESLRIAPQGHKISNSWAFNENSHWRTCSVCSSKITKTDAKHNPQEGKCSTCDYENASPKQETTPETTTETTPETTTQTTPETTGETTSVPTDSQSQPQETEKGGLPWWGILLIGLGAVGAGLVSVLVLKKRQ